MVVPLIEEKVHVYFLAVPTVSRALATFHWKKSLNDLPLTRVWGQPLRWGSCRGTPDIPC